MTNTYYWSSTSQTSLLASLVDVSNGQPIVFPNCRVGQGTAAVAAVTDGQGNIITPAVPSTGVVGTWYATIRTTETLTAPTGVADVTNDPVNSTLAIQVVGIWL
jgi:hypothetical protein